MWITSVTKSLNLFNLTIFILLFYSVLLSHLLMLPFHPNIQTIAMLFAGQGVLGQGGAGPGAGGES